jgi:hypothetical protein
LQTIFKRIPLLFLLLFFAAGCSAQMITGVWRGRINKQKVEVKIIQSGDSLTGTSYYYESPANYRRYSIRGYFDPATNAAVWWDDVLIEEKTGRFNLSAPGKNALLARADFNCPGSGKMLLDGKAVLREDDTRPRGEVHLDKTPGPLFEDEWDFVIDNYTTGGNDPDIIDSIALVSVKRVETEQPIIERKQETIATNFPKKNIETPIKKTETTIPSPVIIPDNPVTPPTIQEKFITRKKVLVTEIPVSGDSIELRFYDNAEIDGDSISLFLNETLIFQHIRLLGSAYTIKLSVADLKESNELIMVAENLGSIPPNTSYMVAIVGQERYDARLESTEGSSAMIKLVKKQ